MSLFYSGPDFTPFMEVGPLGAILAARPSSWGTELPEAQVNPHTPVDIDISAYKSSMEATGWVG